MGGTSTDVALIDARGPQITTESRISEIPISVPVLDIYTVGAGGGSWGRTGPDLLRPRRAAYSHGRESRA